MYVQTETYFFRNREELLRDHKAVVAELGQNNFLPLEGFLEEKVFDSCAVVSSSTTLKKSGLGSFIGGCMVSKFFSVA